MASSRSCPKCQKDAVVVVPAGDVGAGTMRGVANRITPSGFGLGGTSINLHVCTSCGFVEHWADTASSAFQRLRETYRSVE